MVGRILVISLALRADSGVRPVGKTTAIGFGFFKKFCAEAEVFSARPNSVKRGSAVSGEGVAGAVISAGLNALSVKFTGKIIFQVN